MALTPRLDLRQVQSLVMTPQLQQAIKLLQFSSLELAAYVDTLVTENPLLEREDADRDGLSADPGIDAEAIPVIDGEPRAVDSTVTDLPAYAEADLDADCLDNLYDSDGIGEGAGAFDRGAGSWQGRGGSFDGEDANLEEMLSSQPTLQEHLISQLSIEIDDPVDRIIGIHLIDLLDETGYVRGDLAAVAKMLGCSPARVEATLARLQRFDPPGIFARSLAERLALQFEDLGRLDAPMRTLLDHLDLLARHERTALTRLCGVTAEQLASMIAEIRCLNPKPALAFDYAVAHPVTPDVMMRARPGGGWTVELNNETLPRVLINNQYYAQISGAARSKQDKQYISECLQSANWLVKSLHQRATTILKVATEIVRRQHGFFVNGIQSLRPLVLRDIADAIGMHESTVSRVTSNKFIATPRGIYELKYFFTHAVASVDGGEAHSAESVRHRLKALIDAEARNGVLSDDALTEILLKEGVDIARRTVAKYREAMGIPSSVQRRRAKADSF